jgi:hypothetical protein
MKFNDFDREQWSVLKPFFDTILIPISGLYGHENPWQVTDKLEQLKVALDPLEQSFKGRIITFPSIHYFENELTLTSATNLVCSRLREQGFVYCVVVMGDSQFLDLKIESASLIIGPFEDESNEAYFRRSRSAIETLWGEEK